MLELSDALQRVCDHTTELPTQSRSTLDAVGLSLAEAVSSPMSVPLFDKSIMDGFAVRAADVPGQLDVIETITAGHTPSRGIKTGQASQVMTGAPVPDGCDCVVRIEDCRFDESAGCVEIELPASAGVNVLREGELIAEGDAVLPAGANVGPAQLALLIELGIETVNVSATPSAAVLATGDELVPLGEPLGPGQIRNSNEPMLVAQINAHGGRATGLGIARDDENHLSELITQALKSDLVVLSGGVSMGKLDLIPQVLANLGVQDVFHKVRLKPGKPIWFGTGPAGQAVFGLPGNPISSLVCCELFVATALRKMQGKEALPRVISARLEADHLARGDRPTYYPSVLSSEGDSPQIRPLPWKGSADLKTVAAANAFAVFPAGDHTFSAGERVDVLPFGRA